MPFEINIDVLRDHLAEALQMPAIQEQIAAKATPYWGLLFEDVVSELNLPR